MKIELKTPSAIDFKAFPVKALFWSAFCETSWHSFFIFFLSIEKFCQILATCQISDQLDHSNRDYSGGGGGRICPPQATPIYKNPGLFRVKRFYLRLLQTNIHTKKHVTKNEEKWNLEGTDDSPSSLFLPPLRAKTSFSQIICYIPFRF